MIKPKKSLENINAYEVPLFEKDWGLKIDSNENLFGPSPKVIEAIRNIDPIDIQFYPFYGELTQKIAEYTGFEIDNIKVTNGADESISSIFQTYLDPDDVVLTVKPTFAMPAVYSKIVGAELIEIPYSKKWEFPIVQFLKELKNNSKIKIVHLTTPNNPTGETITEENILKIIKLAKDKVVLIDETYGNYCNSNYRELVKKFDNVFIVKSFSKDFALAGLRLGYIISNSENIKHIKSVVSPFSVNSIAVKAGIAALEDCKYFEDIKIEIEKSKSILKEGFEKLGATVYESSANFLCVDFADKFEFVHKILAENDIIVKKFAIPELNGMLRVTAPKPENAILVIEALKEKDTLVFDMDGVLIDAGKSYRLAIKQTFEYFSKKELSFDRIQEVKNQGGLNNDWDLTEYLLKSENIHISKTEIIDKFQKFYWNNGKGFINNEDLLIDKDLIQNLCKDHNLAIFTGRPKQEAIYALQKNGILDYFYPIITMDDLPNDKQKPNTLGIDIIKSKVLTNQMFYFGDTIDDMVCANCSDIKPIGVLPPQDKSESLTDSLKKNGAIIVLNNVNEIKKALEINYEMQF